MALANNAGAFITGLMQGHETKRRWADDKRRREIEDEERAWQKEDRELRRQWAEEDRRIAAEERARQRQRQARDDAYTAWLRGQQQTQVERAEADRDAMGAAFGVAKKKHDKAQQTARADQRKADAGLKPIPAQQTSDQMLVPGSSLSRPSPETKTPSAPSAPSATVAAGIKRATGYEGSRESPERPPTRYQTPDKSIIPPDAGPLAPPRADSIAYSGSRPPSASDAPTTPPRADSTAYAGAPAAQGIRGAAQASQASRPAPQPAQGPSVPPRADSEAYSGEKPVAAPVPSAAPQAQGNVVTPSVETAAKVMGPVKPAALAMTPSKEAKRSATQQVGSFMDYYRKEAVPLVVEHYLSTGDVEKAQAFQQWAEDSAVKDGMKHWARGVHSASIGDEDGFLKAIVSSYNSTGYFEDGYSIVEGKSGFIKDQGGNITGAEITFKNDQTGETNVQKFEDVGDIYEMGVMFLSPEAVFEHGMEQLAAASEQQATLAEEERKHQRALELKRAGEGSADPMQDAMDFLAENDPTFASLAPREQVAKAAELIEAREAAKTAMAQRAATRQALQSGPLFQ